MRKTARLVCDVSLPATGVDGQDRQSPHRHNSQNTPTCNVFHLFRCFYPPLGKKAVKRSREIAMSTRVVVTYTIRVESSKRLLFTKRPHTKPNIIKLLLNFF